MILMWYGALLEQQNVAGSSPAGIAEARVPTSEAYTLAQLAEHQTLDLKVAGSIPAQNYPLW